MTAPDRVAPPAGGLIRPAAELFDEDAVRAALAAECGAADGPRAIRAAAGTVLRRALDSGREAIAAAFRAAPGSALPAVRAWSFLADRVVSAALDTACGRLHPRASPTAGERLSVLAVGGYGRAEMAPHSDVDLLLLTPGKATPWAESVVESMLYLLWDLHLKVGHASRSIADCVRLGREDHTIRTALLERRFVAGDPGPAEELGERLRSDLFARGATEFIEAKLAERAARHARQGGQRYVVEPNVKEGKGGLRDLHSLFWIDKHLHGVTEASDLVARDVLSAGELAAFTEAQEFLLAARCHLHLLSGRATDQLTFDMQVEVAAAMGYADGQGRRAVEHFMQDYFRHATRVGELTRIFLTELEARHVKKEPALLKIFRRRPRVRPLYRVDLNRLNVADREAFLADKLNILRLFEEGLRTGLLIHPDAMRLVAASLRLVDDGMRADREATGIFLDLLLKHGNPERALRRMNELGVLAAFIPEFAPIVAMVQYNMYHSYTVDEHTIQTISVLAQIERGELVEELPVASGILAGGVNRRVLYVALLCHDIGKGRDEDHSVLGARISRAVAPRLGLGRKECETVEWLVRHHLLMSDMAQKRDIADPRTVRDFARAVGGRERLDLLAVLTVCDIRGVGPDAWNNWKAVLIRALYRQTRRALEGGLEALSRERRGKDARENLRAALPDWPAGALKAEAERHRPAYWQGLHVTAHVDFAKLLRDASESDVGIRLTPDPDRDATRVCIVTQDHPGIFSRMCGALALVGADVKDARTFTTRDGWATAAFWIQDGDGAPYAAGKLARLRATIGKIMKGEVVASEAFRSRDRIRKRERAFRVPTSITFNNDGSEVYTIVEVDTRDRPGLLHDLTRALAAANVRIESAVVATYGEQVVDSFYVKDTFGLKLDSPARQRSLERRLRDAIERGAERALEG